MAPEIVRYENSFGKEKVDINEEKISNPEPHVERVQIDTIDISDIKTKPIVRPR